MVFFYFSIFIINLRWEGRWIGSCKLILTLWFTHCIRELEPWCVWWRLVLEHHKTCVYRAPRCSSMHPFGDCFHHSDILLFFSSLIVFAELHVPLLTPSIYLFFPNKGSCKYSFGSIWAKSIMKQTYIKEHVLLLGFPVSPRTSSCKPHRAY